MNKEMLYEFIDSKAIREHLIKIGYELSPIEAALIVYQSDGKTYKEKHQAYQFIIDNMENCKLESRTLEREMTLHELLAKYMEIEENLLGDVMKNGDSAVYTYSQYWNGDINIAHGSEIFTSYDGLVDAVREDNYNCLWVEKKWLSKDKKHSKYIGIHLGANEEIISVCESRYLSGEDDIIHRFFEDEVWIDIPVPFKKGDILTFKQSKYYFPHQGPMVFDYLQQWKMDSEKLKRLKKSWCIIDMTAHGYFLIESRIYYECMHNYLKLDYYEGKLDHEKRILKALSSYFKGDIPIDLLMDAYHIIKTEEALRYERNLQGFLDETKKMAGLNGDKEWIKQE